MERLKMKEVEWLLQAWMVPDIHLLIMEGIEIGGGKDKKFQVYPQIPMLWSNIRLLV